MHVKTIVTASFLCYFGFFCILMFAASIHTFHYGWTETDRAEHDNTTKAEANLVVHRVDEPLCHRTLHQGSSGDGVVRDALHASGGGARDRRKQHHA